MHRRVYIETTIPSFYFETRNEPDMIARRNWTREWWDRERGGYELVTSLAVLEELSRGSHPNKSEALELMADIPLVHGVEEISEIVIAYITHRVMPANPSGDALHLALASYHRCHFLLTWNCRHLANANKFEHIRHVNADLGLFSPVLATPVELLENEGVN
jgi:hypothetical protein